MHIEDLNKKDNQLEILVFIEAEFNRKGGVIPVEKDFRRPFCHAISTYCTTNKLTKEEL